MTDKLTETVEREITRMRGLAADWRRPALRQVEGPDDLKIYGGTIADDIDRWADLLAALSRPNVDEMREALEPLARAGTDKHGAPVGLTGQHILRARATLIGSANHG